MGVRGLRKALFSAAVAVVVGTSAQAAPTVGITIDSVDTVTGATGHYDPGVLDPTPNPDGSFTASGIGYDAAFQCNWDLTVNPDPQITSTFTLHNLSVNTTNFVMTVTLPIAAIGPTTKQGGYFGDAVNGTTYTDTSGPGGDGAVTLATVGLTPFYQALVNGVLSQGLGSFSLVANGGPGASGQLSQQDWGTPIPSALFGPASTNIQIRWTFSVTGLDSMGTQGFFQVLPEPGALLLIGLGLGALAAARRRSA